MQVSARFSRFSLAPILPPAIRRWAVPLDPALNRILIPDQVTRGLEEASRHGSGADFARHLLKNLDVRFAVEQSQVSRIPASGPAVAVCNHPYGIVEGLILLSLIDTVRQDYKLIANSMLAAVGEVRDQVILVNPFETAGAFAQNRAPLRQALSWLAGGGLLVMFPAGEVAHLNWREHTITDPPWKTTAARIALRRGCPVVPIYFEGANSVPFQLAGTIHPGLRTIRLAREFHRLRGKTVRLRIGSAIPSALLSAYKDPERATEYLRSRTYFLAHRGETRRSWKHIRRSSNHRECAASPVSERLLAEEVAALPAERELAATSGYAVYIAGAAEIPHMLQEIGRCRELAFRSAGEGTGKSIDLDRFDEYYRHLFLWSKRDSRLAGAYRLAVTSHVLPERGIDGLYTGTLFRFAPEFFEKIGPAVELGRSFIVPEYQKSYSALFLLWKAILRFMQYRPEAGLLFGAVSISRDYQAASRALMASYLSSHVRHPLAGLVQPRTSFREPLMHRAPIRSFANLAANIEDVSLSIAEIEADGKGIPVLVRQYLAAGGRLLGFNVDRNFSDALDVLLLVDLSDAPPALLERCMGRAEAKSFLELRCAKRAALFV